MELNEDTLLKLLIPKKRLEKKNKINKYILEEQLE